MTDFPISADHPDRLRWNAKYTGRDLPFAARPLAERALLLPLPPGPVLDLACGPSGSALLAAASGRHVTAVDISDVALAALADEVRRRGLTDLVTLVQADLEVWRPEASSYALTFCLGFWDRSLFPAAAAAVLPGGAVAWQAFTLAARQDHPGLPAEWCLRPEEPGVLLPADFTVQAAEEGRGTRSLIATRRSTS